MGQGPVPAGPGDIGKGSVPARLGWVGVTGVKYGLGRVGAMGGCPREGARLGAPGAGGCNECALGRTAF
ncbi:MAG TPA: hypothetical protein VGJ57_11335 [Nitrospirales bacterium]|jgi:hypothetical protein